jgi:hypothetical protein
MVSTTTTTTTTTTKINVPVLLENLKNNRGKSFGM